LTIDSSINGLTVHYVSFIGGEVSKMNRIVSFAILCVLMVRFFLADGWELSAHAMSFPNRGTVDVIIQTDAGKTRVARSLRKMGAEVKFSYKNAPVLAATIPVEGLQEIYSHPNVVKVAKDRLVFLSDDQDDARPLSVAGKDYSANLVRPIRPVSSLGAETTQGYSYFLFSQADQVWRDTSLGDGSVVAVVDTGTVPNACLAHAVIGAPGFANGYNATHDGIPATDPRNDWHGTHIGGVIASACTLDFSNNPSDPLYQAISTYLPLTDYKIPVYGQAPGAQIYPVKVFTQNGSGSQLSVILDGLDHLLTLSRENLLDIDVVNLSFGGPSWYDGRDILDTFLAQFREENILVIAAAGNGGPLPNSIASPGTSFDSLTVGALDYAASSRAIYEYLGLISGLGPGQGLVMRPTDETRVANLSSRGPMSDGRRGPDLAAPGMWSFQFGPNNEPRWASGTSFSSAAVSGIAALLNAFYESKTDTGTPLIFENSVWLGDAGQSLDDSAAHQQDTLWEDLRNSLLMGANFNVVGTGWQDINMVGFGAVDAESAFQIFKNGAGKIEYPHKAGKLSANILGKPESGSDMFASPTVSLDPGQSYDLVLEINAQTSHVTVQVYDITTPDNFGHAFWPNSLKIQVQSAKRTDFPQPINEYWDPNLSGDSFTVEIEDGLWSLEGVPKAQQPIEPGLMKVSLVGDFANESAISFKVQVIREQDAIAGAEQPIALSVLKTGEAYTVPVEIPPELSKATFDLVWQRDWQKFPTSDIDMLVFDPDGQLVSTEGATGNSPERAEIIDPLPGTWTVSIEAIEVPKPDVFRLYMETEFQDSVLNSAGMLRHQPSPFDIIAKQLAADSALGNVDDTASAYIIWLPIIP
jgi:hypothetical protein